MYLHIFTAPIVVCKRTKRLTCSHKIRWALFGKQATITNYDVRDYPQALGQTDAENLLPVVGQDGYRLVGVC